MVYGTWSLVVGTWYMDEGRGFIVGGFSTLFPLPGTKYYVLQSKPNPARSVIWLDIGGEFGNVFES
jgi:hypothetical protein